MIKSIFIGNNIEMFYTEFSNIIRNMFPDKSLTVTRISDTIGRVTIKRSIMDTISFYVVNLFPNTSNTALQQLVICNKLTLVNNEIDFTQIETNNIGPVFNSAQPNSNYYIATDVWINNTKVNTDSSFSSLTNEQKMLMCCSVDTLCLASNNYNENEYIWVGFKAKQEINPLLFITNTNDNNISMFGVSDPYIYSPTSIYGDYIKSVTTLMNDRPVLYKPSDLCVDSTIICLSNIIIPQSTNHEYLPYIYLCVGRDSSTNYYVQLVSNGVEYYKIINDDIVIVSNPKFTIYQKLVYTINIDNAYYYELNGTIKLLDNSNEVTVDWGDNTPIETIPANTPNLNLSHTYNNGGIYDITISYLSLANPTNLGNIIYIDKYTSDVDLSKARDITELSIINIFKDTIGINTRLKTVSLPARCIRLTSTGFCENCESLSDVTFPAETDCIITGNWLENSSYGSTDIANIFEYPNTVTFQFSKFYTGNFGRTIIINSNMTGGNLYVNNNVQHLVLGGRPDDTYIAISNIEPDDLSQLSTNSLTDIIFKTGFDSAPDIRDFPNLTTITYEGTPYNNASGHIQDLDSLITLNVSTVNNLGPITECPLLTTLTLSPNLTNFNSSTSDNCSQLYAFIMSTQSPSGYYTNGGVLYQDVVDTVNNITVKHLVRVPYGYLSNNLSYAIPNTVNVIDNYALCINGQIDYLTIPSNITSIADNCFVNDYITTLQIDTDILSNVEFAPFYVTNLELTENVTTLSTNTFANVSITSLSISDTDIVLTTDQFDMNSLELIQGYVGSTAETFAINNNITFVPIDFGTQKSKYYITTPTDNYTISNVCNLSDSYSLLDWGDDSDPVVLYTLETNLTHTYNTAGDYVVTITHIAPTTIDYSYTSIYQGLFALATKLDFSEITLGSAAITGAFNNLPTLEELDYPSNVTAINGTLNNTNNITTITFPTTLTTLQNSFNNQDYDDVISFIMPATLTTISNCFNNTNIIPTTLSINTTNISGLSVTDSFNDNATTSLTLGDKVNSISNSFNNCLSLSTLTCDNNNTSLLAENNMLYNKTKTTLVLVPGGLSSFTIPTTTTTTVSQSSIANSKTYSAISIPENISTITFPCYTPRNETQSTNITTLTINNPYTSISSINKTIQVSLQGNVDTSTITSVPTYDPSHTYTDGEYMMYNGTIYVADSVNGSNIIIGDNLFVTYASRLKDSDYAYIDNGYFESYGNYSWYQSEDFYSTGSIPLTTGKNYKFVTPAWYCSNNHYYALAVFVNTSGSWNNSNYVANYRYGYAGGALTWDQTVLADYVHMSVYKPNESEYAIYELSTQKFSVATYYYNDTANITNITAYEHSVANSQIDGYDRYPNCSSYNFTSLGYYNSSLVIGSNYTDVTFTNNDLLDISNSLITAYNNRFNYIIPDTNVYSHLSELVTYVCTNGYDFVTAGYPYVIFYYNDTINNIYDYIIYVFENSATNTGIMIDNSNYTYSTMYFTVDYDVTNQAYSNLVSNSTFTTRELVTLNPNIHAVLSYYNIASITDNNDANITPTFLEYTTLIKANTSDFTGYVIGSNKTGTNKLFISNPTIRIDDYWIDVSTNEIDADNIVNIASFTVDSSKNIVSGSGQTLNNISDDVTYLKLIRTDKYMFKNNVELVSAIYVIPTT